MSAKFSILTKYWILLGILGIVLLFAVILHTYRMYTFTINNQAKSLANEGLISFYSFTKPGKVFIENIHLYLPFRLQGEDWSVRVRFIHDLISESKNTSFEAKVLKEMVKKRNTEIGRWQKLSITGESTYRYLKAIRVEKNCLKCHGDLQKLDPEFKEILESKYSPQEFSKIVNYREGQIIGFVDVTIKQSLVKNLMEVFKLSKENLPLYLSLLGILIALSINYIAVHGLIKRILNLRDIARKISIGELDVDLGVKGLDEHKVKDELILLAIALERLRISTKILIERFKKR